MWIIEKRVANTDQWGRVGTADTEAEAERRAKTVLGGQSTGARIRPDDEDVDAEPRIVVGC